MRYEMSDRLKASFLGMHYPEGEGWEARIVAEENPLRVFLMLERHVGNSVEYLAESHRSGRAFSVHIRDRDSAPECAPGVELRLEWLEPIYRGLKALYGDEPEPSRNEVLAKENELLREALRVERDRVDLMIGRENIISRQKDAMRAFEMIQSGDGVKVVDDLEGGEPNGHG